MQVVIKNRVRSVKWVDGWPVIMVGGRPVRVTCLLTPGTDNPKTAKNASELFIPFGIVLAPHKSGGVGNLCAFAAECIKSCLNHQGRGSFGGEAGLRIHGSRIARTVVYQKERQWFLDRAHYEVEKLEANAAAEGKRLCIRPNMFSDIPWEHSGLLQAFPNVQWYDYTKNPRRVGQVLDNYWVTFSRDSSKDDETCKKLISEGKNVAIAFDDGRTTNGRNLHGIKVDAPTTWEGFRAINGDETDARWTDPKGVAVMLRLKAASLEQRLQAVNSGFAIGVK